MALRELTLADMRDFEKWLCEATGKRDMEMGMAELGQMESVMQLLRIAGCDDPEAIPLSKLNEIVGELGIPFPTGGPLLPGLPNAASPSPAP